MIEKANPIEAAKLVEELLSSSKTSFAAPDFVKSMVQELAKQGHNEAINWAKSLPESLKNIAIETSVNSWIEQDLPAASKWVNSQADTVFRDTFIPQIGNKLLELPPSQDAAAWAKDIAHSPNGANHTKLISSIWASHDLTEASNWSRELNDRQAQAAASIGIAVVVAQQGLNAAESWINELPNENGLRDEVIHMVAYELDAQVKDAGLELTRRLNHQYAAERDLAHQSAP